VLGDVAELVPVAGLASAVPIVRLIVDELRVSMLSPCFAFLRSLNKLDIQKTCENRDTARELAEDIHNLVKMIEETVNAVRNNIKSMQEVLEGQNKSLELDEYESPAVFNEMVAELTECA
jgi:hypothetical protein